LDYRLVRAVLTHPLYPGVLRWSMAAVFALVGYQLLAGPASEHDNLGSALMWVVWWPLLPIVIVVLGRFWCAICPFATLSDWVRTIVGL
jgi:polyferredoxin